MAKTRTGVAHGAKEMIRQVNETQAEEQRHHKQQEAAGAVKHIGQDKTHPVGGRVLVARW